MVRARQRVTVLAIVVLAAIPVTCRADQEPGAGAPGGDAYQLGAEDAVQIQIWSRPDLSQSVMLDSAGKIHLPIVGEIEARGLTTEALGKALTERYQLFDHTIPEAIVTVAQYNSQSVSVVGEVRVPGKYGFKRIPDVWTVLLGAGGPTPGADLSHVQVLHYESEGDRPRTERVDLSKGLEAIQHESLPALRPRDTIVVPSVIEGPATGDRYQVFGAVHTPGAYRIGTAGSVLQAIAAAGGALPEADLRRVRVSRQTAGGSLSYELDLFGSINEGRPTADPGVRPGDTISIPQRGGFSLRSAMNWLVPFATVVVSGWSLARASR
jgi:polysaccharide export outer membrane protein